MILLLKYSDWSLRIRLVLTAATGPSLRNPYKHDDEAWCERLQGHVKQTRHHRPQGASQTTRQSTPQLIHSSHCRSENPACIADEDGGAYIRFLNRRTSVVGFLRLADDDQMWLEFVDVRPDTVVRRRIGFEGDETIARPR